MSNSEFLNWLSNRLVYAYNESEDTDFVQKLRDIAAYHEDIEAGISTIDQFHVLIDSAEDSLNDIYKRLDDATSALGRLRNRIG